MFEHADDPARERLDKCFAAAGADPAACPECDGCEACAVGRWREWTPEPLAAQACQVQAYIEAFRPDPRRVTWRELELYQGYLMGKSAYERSKYNGGGS